MNLIIVCTNRCNLNCRYCKNVKENSNISYGLLRQIKRQVIDKNIKNIGRVKFFGGEPLLEIENIKKIITDLRKEYKDLAFYLTTNGTLLTKPLITWFKKHKVTLAISLDGNRFTQGLNRRGGYSFENLIAMIPQLSRDTIFNMVIAPNNVKYLAYNFAFLRKIGVKNVNFLPAYYNPWTEKQLQEFSLGLQKILAIIKKIDKKDTIFIKNVENFSEVSFFNSGLVVDTDGSYYQSDAILNQYFRPYRRQFLVRDLCAFFGKSSPDFERINKLLIKLCPKDKMLINNKLDVILNNFVYKLKKIYG